MESALFRDRASELVGACRLDCSVGLATADFLVACNHLVELQRSLLLGEGAGEVAQPSRPS